MTTPAPAPVAEPSRMQRVLPVVGVGAGVAVLTGALHLRDPHAPGSWGVCPTALLGFACPGCGGLRAVHHLTDLDLVAAASSNLLLVVLAPVAVVLWVRALVRARRGASRPWALAVPMAVWWLLAAVTVLFAVLRNLPVGAWLAP